MRGPFRFIIFVSTLFGASSALAAERVAISQPHPEELATAAEEAEEEANQVNDPAFNAQAPSIEPDGAIPTFGYLPIAGETDTIVSPSSATVTSTGTVTPQR